MLAAMESGDLTAHQIEGPCVWMDDCVWVTNLGVYRLYDRAVIVEMNEYIIYIYIYIITPN